ncbi:MAG TPA: alkaline phosphatase family protein [Kofleriaceae bacterium]|nr:alkaline phosphatase family protein [Kofleriaceae bacterium]
MKRRDALKTIGGLAGAAGLSRFLPACGSDDDGPVGITTYVYLMMENRTYDHFLGARSLVEGLPGDGLKAGMSNPNLSGTQVPIFQAGNDKGQTVAQVCDPDPPHGWDASHAQYNAGAMDGFVQQYQTAHGGSLSLTEPMKYMTRDNLPITWALADAYTTCDRWFASVMGPTLPNRAYWHTATSFGLNNNNDVLNKFSMGVPVPTIYNRLVDVGVDWAYYYGTLAVAALLAQPGPYQLDIGPNDGTGNVRRFGDAKVSTGQFFRDAAAGKLPPVVYIDPAFGTNDDHPPVHPILGQELIASVYTALAKSPQWKNCMLVITYDEHGGYFDHVPPPTGVDDTLEKFGVDGFQQRGFRVPAMVIGPYAKQGYVSSVEYDHTSALKHLQNAFGLEPLNPRMAAANDLIDCIDMDRLMRGEPAPPIELPVINSDDYPTTAPACIGDSDFRFEPDPITAWANEHPDAFAGYDARGDAESYVRSIRDYLRHQGVVR